MTTDVLGVNLCDNSIRPSCLLNGKDPMLSFWFVTVFTMIGILAGIFLIVKFIRDPNKSPKFKFLVCILLIPILIASLIFLEKWTLESTSYLPVAAKRQEIYLKEQKQKVKIPSYVIETSDRLIIDRIGKERFDKDIILDNNETLELNIPKIDINNSYTPYKIAYRFSPLKVLNNDESEALFYVDVEDKNSPYYQKSTKSRTKIVNNILPDCTVEPSLCEFKLTANDVKVIANRNNFNADDLEIFWNPWELQKLLIEVTSCKLKKAMYINYMDGSVISIKDIPSCRESVRSVF